MGCHSLLFVTQELNLHLLHYQMDSSPLNYQGSPKIMFFTYIYIYKYIFILYIVEYSYAQLQERMKFCNNMDGLGGYHAY